MNYSHPMKVLPKRLFISWLIMFIIGLLIGFSITFSTDTKEVKAVQFAQKVQEVEQTPELIELGEHRITAYCGCKKCCGEWAKNRPDGIVYGAGGDEFKEGVSVAASLPLGTEILIAGLGEFVVQDRIASWVTEKYDGKVIDIYFDNHEKAQNFGVQQKEVFIIKEVGCND